MTTKPTDIKFERKILTKSEQDDIVKRGVLNYQPKCLSCGDTHGTLWRWRCYNKSTNEAFSICLDCLEQHTFEYDVDDIDWTKRINLANIKVCYCETCGEAFVSGDKTPPRYCHGQCDPSIEFNTTINRDHDTPC